MDDRLSREFPIDWEEDNYVSRREFFKFMTLASGMLALGSAGIAAWSQMKRGELRFDPARIAGIADVEVGGSLGFSYPRPNDICILVQPEPGRYVAFSRRCTHLSCPVSYEHDQRRLFCPCHNGAFSIEDGSVLQGPPPHGLPQVVLRIRDDGIYAVGVSHKDEHA
jgi:nitrite reductase/ring-hydroxylating ferredoxin subunit